jgi:hypothetical protein
MNATSHGPLQRMPAALALYDHPVWKEIHPLFQPREFRFPYAMDVYFLRLLYATRILAAVPFRPRSDHRPEDQNTAAQGAIGSAHIPLPCRAIDLAIRNNYERFQIVAAAIAQGFERIGIYPAHQDNSGTLHLDASSTHPQPRIWTRY